MQLPFSWLLHLLFLGARKIQKEYKMFRLMEFPGTNGKTNRGDRTWGRDPAAWLLRLGQLKGRSVHFPGVAVTVPYGLSGLSTRNHSHHFGAWEPEAQKDQVASRFSFVCTCVCLTHQSLSLGTHFSSCKATSQTELLEPHTKGIIVMWSSFGRCLSPHMACPGSSEGHVLGCQNLNMLVWGGGA